MYICVCVCVCIQTCVYIYIFLLQPQKPVKNFKSNLILKYNKINIVMKNYHNLKQFKEMLSVDLYFIFFI